MPANLTARLHSIGQRAHSAGNTFINHFRQVDECFQHTWSKATTPYRGGESTPRPGLKERYRQATHRIPMVYKLSILITVLIVTCMGLLGSIIVQQQTQLFEEQINEQGSTLVRLMAQAAKEPLLAEDKLALDAITTGFSFSNSVLGTAIISLEGITISHTGEYHDGTSSIQRQALEKMITSAEDSLQWELPPKVRNTPRRVVSFVYPVTFRNVIAGYAMVTFSQSGMDTSLRQALRAIAGATVLIILLGIALAIMLGKRISEPIGKLVDASRAIGRGDYNISFNEKRGDEIGHLMEAFSEMAEGLLEKSQVTAALSRYVSSGVAKEILANLDDVELGGKRVEGTVIFVDIVGFTQISENIKPEDLVSILNNYFSLITHACELNHGFVDKYMGDGVMLVFGAPQPDDDHSFNAINCALLIQRLIDRENQHRQEQGLFPVRFRVGINSGTMLAGNMGSKERMEYTVVGDTVNLASRLCGISNSGQIIISRELYMQPNVRKRVLAGEYQAIRLRGIKHPVTTYIVENLAADCQEILDDQFRIITQADNDEHCNTEII